MSDDRTEERHDDGRRAFLKLATVAAPAAAMATVSGEAAAEDLAEQSGSGLRKTAHVKKYLESARF